MIKNMDKFANFLSYLKTEERNDFYIDLHRIEEMIGQPLSKSAYVHAAYWYADGIHSFAMQILECGFRVSPDLRNERIRLYRADPAAIKPRVRHERHSFNNRSYIERPLSYKVVDDKVELTPSVNKFIKIYKSDNNSRYYSYDHIRQAFLSYRKDPSKRDLLTLYLYAYLASWGMLRNSFLMQKDYKFLTPIVDILCNSKYEELINYNPFIDNDHSKAYLFMEVVSEMKNYFHGQTYFLEGDDKPYPIEKGTDTLYSKILLGTYGCTVAYDRYVRDGLSKHKMIQKIGVKSFLEIREFAKANQEEIESILSKLNSLYTPMKIVDMYFFEKGFEK